MNYIESIKWIESTNIFGSVLGLSNINKLMNLLGNIQNKLKVIHIAGTNGKGSTANYINNILISSGYKVGLYTSPYIEELKDMIKVNNEVISNEDFSKCASYVKEKVDEMVKEGFVHPTRFEIMVAISFYYFYNLNIQFVILETGLGGRLDATNIVNNTLASVITPISYDHTEYLGNTLDKIAYEKSEIIKKNSIVISSKQKDIVSKIIKNKAKKMNCIYEDFNNIKVKIKESNDINQIFDVNINNEIYNDVKLNMIGKYQIDNAILAILTCNKIKEKGFNITKESIYNGLYNTKWVQRLEIINKNKVIILDGAHNENAILKLVKFINEVYNKKINLLFGVLKDKNVDIIVKNIVTISNKIVLTKPDSNRALSLNELKKYFNNLGKECILEEDINKALNKVRNITNKDEIILVCGSLYLTREVSKNLK